MPKPIGAPSISSPTAFAKSPLPSARNLIVSLAPLAFDHASITKTSLTEVQAIVVTPFALNSAACCRNPGRCIPWQVGVNAPGTANSTAFLPLKRSSVEISEGPVSVITLNLACGSGLPTVIGMKFSSGLQGHNIDAVL